MSSLSEINKTLKEQLSAIEYGNRGTDDLRAKFSAFVSGMKGEAGDRLEREREEARRVSAAGPQGMGRGFGSALGGLSKLAGIAGFLGLAGLAAMQFLDGKKIAENVEAILGIGERYSEDTLKTLLSDGAVILALKGLGAGLLVFSAGAAASAGVNALDKATLDKFETSTGWSENVATNVNNLLGLADGYTLAGLGILIDGAGVSAALAGLGAGLTVFAAGSGLAQFANNGTQWATDLKTNVQTLLSIADGPLENIGMLFEAASFPLAMTGLAAGLGVFGVGSAVAIGSDAFAKWTGSTDWATNIKDNVVTLLGIKDSLGGNWEMLKDGGAFVLAMTGIGIGLGTFGAGAILAGGTDMLGDWFATGTNWAQQVVDNVTTLLSIADLPNVGYDTAGFVAVMGGIAAGLIAFGTAGTATSVMDALSDWISPGEGRQNWTEELKKNVKNVLSIVDLANEGKATQFVSAMAQISAGLVAFAGANFIGGLTNAATAILKFFTGAESPFDQIMKVADNADPLEKGADAVDSLTASIEKLGKLKFDGRRINMKAFALDLADSLKVIETAIDGGTFDASWLPFDAKTVKGLSSPDIDYSAAIKNIENLRAALRIGVTPGDVLDRYGNTFTLPTNLDTIPAYGSGSGFSDSLRLGGDGRGPMRIRPGFEENSLDALAEQARLNGNTPIIINQTDNSNNSTNTSSTSSVVSTAPTQDQFQLESPAF